MRLCKTINFCIPIKIDFEKDSKSNTGNNFGSYRTVNYSY
jgi:hypothetical protein